MNTLEYLGNFVKNSNAKNYRLSDADLQSKNAMMIMSEHDEVANQLIDEEVGSVLKKFGVHINFIHITDQKLYNNFPLFLRAEISMPKGEGDTEGQEAAYTLLGLLLRLADNVANLKLFCQSVKKAGKT